MAEALPAVATAPRAPQQQPAPQLSFLQRIAAKRDLLRPQQLESEEETQPKRKRDSESEIGKKQYLRCHVAIFKDENLVRRAGDVKAPTPGVGLKVCPDPGRHGEPCLTLNFGAKNTPEEIQENDRPVTSLAFKWEPSTRINGEYALDQFELFTHADRPDEFDEIVQKQAMAGVSAENASMAFLCCAKFRTHYYPLCSVIDPVWDDWYENKRLTDEASKQITNMARVLTAVSQQGVKNTFTIEINGSDVAVFFHAKEDPRKLIPTLPASYLKGSYTDFWRVHIRCLTTTKTSDLNLQPGSGVVTPRSADELVKTGCDFAGTLWKPHREKPPLDSQVHRELVCLPSSSLPTGRISVSPDLKQHEAEENAVHKLLTSDQPLLTAIKENIVGKQLRQAPVINNLLAESSKQQEVAVFPPLIVHHTPQQLDRDSRAVTAQTKAAESSAESARLERAHLEQQERSREQADDQIAALRIQMEFDIQMAKEKKEEDLCVLDARLKVFRDHSQLHRVRNEYVRNS
ncbi:uncharacterized protein KY384_003844 [Bacidia gigantensis]|uniref:uncharacterized protein n=1 Tax=Bacidia gigantensis TaxID=2732470 RepID=UPI001D037D75|nr:uncharacterized protein KY384_003844 [Bacidia gigantensis]KAG8532203.1 hypothetical protein KY384_003844 [Bacidia gigantensis]